MVSLPHACRSSVPFRCGPKDATVGVIKRRYGKAKRKFNVSINAPKKIEKLTVATPQWEPTCCTHLPVREEFVDLYAGAASHPPSELTISEWMKADDRDIKPTEVRLIGGVNNAAAELGWTCTDESDEESDRESDGGGDNGCNDLNTENEEELEDSLEGAEMDKLIKRTGVPAVMRCFDRAKIFVKGGNGGKGEVAFLREKFQPEGGPSGGNGGPGGNVYAEVDEEMNSLLPFRNKMHFRGGKGGNGLGKKQNGGAGEDIVVKVAPGTVIRNVDEKGQVGDVLAEILHLRQRVLLVPGGRGGRGNATFKCGTNNTPKIAENGEEGKEMWLELELKLVADVGIIGIPNAGKSTLLGAVSDAQPNIAPYPYTTLLPNLGVVSFDYGATLVVADLPGLLEGAHRGFGLGHEFLRHTERCCVLVHVIDGSSAQPEHEYDAVRLELEMFNPELSEKPFIVAYNKMDLPEARERWVSFNDSLRSRGIHPFPMSALQRDGTHSVIDAANTLFQTLRKDAKFKDARAMIDDEEARLPASSPLPSIRDFHVSHDAGSRTWNVCGQGLQRFIQMTNWSYADSERRFEHVLEACGLSQSLEKKGIQEGDIVLIGQMEMAWHDYKDASRPPTLIRRSSYSAV